MNKEFVLSIPKVITPDGCWLAKDKYSCGDIGFQNEIFALHRVVAYLWHGGFDIFKPNDATICHTCKNDTTAELICFGPEHLYVGTASSNTQDSIRDGKHWNARKTHCSKGHLLRTIFSKTRGKIERVCWICKSKSTIESNKRMRAKAKQVVK